jgi:copper chaperone CopZ
MIRFVFILILCILTNVQTNAQTPAASKTSLVTNNFRVYGNCEMCKSSIEGVAKLSGAKTADWNLATDTITIRFDPNKTTLEKIQKNIAAIGYDNDGFRGDDISYSRLPHCCQYDRKEVEELEKKD